MNSHPVERKASPADVLALGFEVLVWTVVEDSDIGEIMVCNITTIKCMIISIAEELVFGHFLVIFVFVANGRRLISLWDRLTGFNFVVDVLEGSFEETIILLLVSFGLIFVFLRLFFISALLDQGLLLGRSMSSCLKLFMMILRVNDFLVVRLEVVLMVIGALAMLLTASLIVVLTGFGVMMLPRMVLREHFRLFELMVVRMLRKILVIIVTIIKLTESKTTSLILSLYIGFVIIFWVDDLVLLITLIVNV